MKKIRYILLIILTITELLLCLKNLSNKEYLAKIIGMENVHDIIVIRVKRLSGIGSGKPCYIRFLISKDKYNQYGLHYEERRANESLYEGEIHNIRESFGSSYICTYGRVIYDSEIKDNLYNIANIRLLLSMNTVLLVIILLMFTAKYFKNIKTRESIKIENIKGRNKWHT